MKRLQQEWSGVLWLVLYCVLVSSRWLVVNAYPQATSTSLSQIVGLCVAAAWFGARSFSVGTTILETFGRPRLFIAGPGYCVAISGGVLGEWIFGRHLSASLFSLAFSLTPVLALLVASITNPNPTTTLVDGLWPGLAGMAGLLLLLAPPRELSFQEWTGLASIPLLTGIGAVLAFGPGEQPTTSTERGLVSTPAVGCLLAAAVCGARTVASHPAGEMSFIACGLDAVMTILCVQALSQLGATRWSAQFLLVPLLGFLEGILFLRPNLDYRTWGGMILLAIGGTRLLLASGRTDEPDLGLLSQLNAPR